MEFFTALPEWASLLVGIALVGALAMALLAVFAVGGMVLNCCVGQLARIPVLRSSCLFVAKVNMRLLRLSRHVPAWVIYLGLLVFLVVLAAALVYDQHPKLQDPKHDPALSSLNALYRGLTLLAFGADWTLPAAAPSKGIAEGPQLGWLLQAIRFGLPILAIAGLFVTLIKSFGHGLQRHIMPRYGHTVVCGLGEAGMAYVEHLKDLGAYLRHGPIVVIERDPENPNIDICRSLGVPVIVGDALNATGDILREARTRRAERVIGLLREDRANVQFVLRVQQRIGREGDRWWERLWRQAFGDVGRPLPRIIAQVDDPQLAHRMEHYEKITKYSTADVRFHNIHAIQAQQFLLQYPPDLYADLFGQPAPHFVIYGFGRLGQQVFSEAVRLCQFRSGAPPSFTIVDRDIERVRRILDEEVPEIYRKRGMAPQIALIRALHGVTIDPPALSAAMLDKLVGWRAPAVVTQHVICFSDEEKAVSLAIALRDQLMQRRNANAPIFVRTRRVRGMATLLDSNSGQQEIPDGLFPFASLETALDPRALDNAWVEDLAYALHVIGYLNRADPRRRRPADQPWEQLDDLHRRGNRLAALHADAKLRALGLHRFARPRPTWLRRESGQRDRYGASDTVYTVPIAQWEPLADLEHRRYVAVRLADGWRSGDSRSDALRRHTVFVPYDRLDPENRANDRNMTRILPALIAGDPEATACAAADVAPDAGSPAARRSPPTAQEIAPAVRKLARHGQDVRPVRRIAVIGPCGARGACGEDKVAADSHELTRQLAREIDAGDRPLRQSLETDAVSILSPLVHSLERAVVTRLVDVATGGRPAGGDPETLWARRLEIVGLLPLPYDFMREHEDGRFFARGCSPGMAGDGRFAEQEAEAFCTEVGRRHVRYVEMPLRTAPGDALAVQKPEAAVQAAEAAWRDQWRLTAAYLVDRCETVILVRGPAAADPMLDEVKAWAETPWIIPGRLRTPTTGLLPETRCRRIVELRAPGMRRTPPAR